MRFSNQKGQSTLEAAWMAFMLSLFVVAFLGTLYRIYASYWMEHIMYESLICYQERSQKETCLNEAKKKMDRVLFFRKGLEIKILGSGSRTQSQIKMRIDPPFLDPVHFKLRKELRI